MIGKKIYDYRKQEKLSQEELAEKIGVTRQTISNWELGETTPDIEQAKNISQVLGISLDELTSNKTDYLILKKVTKNESSLKRVIAITGITLGISILFILLTCYILIQIFKYFEATPVSQSVRLNCEIDGTVNYYEIGLDNNDHVTSFSTDNPELEDLDITNYPHQSELLKYIHEYVANKNGTCGK